MAIFDWMANLAIDAAGGGKAVFGEKPEVAPYVETDLGAEAKKAAASNIANIPEVQALLEKILPGYGAMVAQGSKNTNALLRGEIPQDVQDTIRRTSAFKAFRGGFGGSGMAKSLTARDFGLTSLDLMERGSNSAQRWAGLTQAGVAPWMITGAQQGDQTFKNNLYKQATQQMAFNVAAAPDPAAAGLFNTIATIGGTAASFGLGAMGGMGGSRAPAPAAPAGGSGGAYAASPYSAYGPYRDTYAWGSYGG